MDIKSFKIVGFRSLKDTPWLPLSIDGVTALVGQNESGKSSILDALSLGFGSRVEINTKDFRSDSDYPEIFLQFRLDDFDINEIFEGYQDSYSMSVRRMIESQPLIEFVTAVKPIANSKFARAFSLGRDLTSAILDLEKQSGKEHNLSIAVVDGEEPSDEEVESGISLPVIIRRVWALLPLFVLFNEATCTLPDSIDVVSDKLQPAPGQRGASNFLSAAGVSLEKLLKAEDRSLATLTKRANLNVTKELQNFWSQVLGKEDRVTLEFELKHHDASKGDKSGAPYLVFWVSEGDGERLHPSQRSRGTRWFISFFLEMFASQKGNRNVAFLLDEPGAFLHAYAQKDVLRLIDDLGDLRPIIYSTHSPYLIDQTKIFRILAVERIGFEQGSETKIRRGLELAASSQVTLAPILAAMGAAFSDQSVIKRSGNVLLEESSGYYYLMAFCKLLDAGHRLSFVACGGVDTVRTMVDLMVAWGIEHMVLVDDDAQGKKVCRDLRDKYHLAEGVAKKRLQTITGFSSVEDVFEKNFFHAIVAQGHDLDTSKSNSEAVREAKVSKPMLAVNFFEAVRTGRVSRSDVDAATLGRFEELIGRAQEFFEGAD